jgi:hypothetical protein
MDLDSLKKKSAQITAPAIGTQIDPTSVRTVDNLIRLLKQSDERERRQLRKAVPFYVIAALVFVIAFVAVIVPGGMSLNPSTLLRGMLMILYVGLTLALGMKLRGLAKIDYSEPVRSFLSKAERRYAFVAPEFHVFGLSITLFLAYIASLYINNVLRRTFEIANSSVGLIVTLLFFVLVYGFGSWATWKNWKRDKQAVWLQVKTMREELDREEDNGNS